MTNKTVHVIGGGTVSHIRTHLALSAPAYGGTARKLVELCKAHDQTMDVVLHLTKMADSESSIETNNDLKALALSLVDDSLTKIVFFNAAVVDFDGQVGQVVSGSRAARLRTSDTKGLPLAYELALTPAPKLLSLFRKGGEGRAPRKDIFLVGFKATAGATEDE